MTLSSMRKTFIAIVGSLALAALLLTLPSRQEAAGGTQEPANKVSASGSTIEVFNATPGTNVVVLMSELVKTSKPTDLILGVTAECSITTEITTVGNDTEYAEGLVRIWVEIDGITVPVSTDDTSETGKVVFCNRKYLRQTSMFDDEDATIRTFMATRSANGFNWMALNVGSATHRIEVKAELTNAVSSADATAMAAVGKRTLIVEPVKSANNETVSTLN